VPLGQPGQLGVAVGVGRNRRPSQHRSGVGVDHRGGMGVLVRVDADDDLDQFCQHGHAFCP
jgi:hypothetical protein